MAEYDDSYSFCPKCGKEKFSVEIPDYQDFPVYHAHQEFTDISSHSDRMSADVPAAPVQTASAPAEDDGDVVHYYLDSDFAADDEMPDEVPASDETQVFSISQQNEAETSDDESDSSPADEVGEPESEPQTEQQHDEAEQQVQQRPVAPQRKAMPRRVPAVNRRAENKTLAVIIVIMCVVAVLAASLSVLKINTDTLETTEPVQKVVASVGLSAQEEVILEEILARGFAVLKTGHNSELCDAEELLKKVNPYDKGGVYSMVYNEYPEVETQADPANRFYNGQEESYAYYKLEEKKVDDLMSMFGVEAHHAVNTESCYYYDGFYYFGYAEQKATLAVNADITKSRRVLDGSYYSEVYFYAENGEKRVETDKYYILTEKTGDAQTGELFFKVKKLSATPIFDSNGKLAEKKAYKIKRQVIEGKTDDGKVYCRYIFEYPVFSEDNVCYRSINTFFNDAINIYKLKADSAQKSYESFIQQGGKDSELPVTETVIARVGFENEGYVSVIEKIGIDGPQPVNNTAVAASEDDGKEEESKGVTLFERLVEGYVFDKNTGEFVSKDVLAGKDYLTVSEILYRIYNGNDYESLLPDADAGEEDSESEDYYYDEEEEAYDEDGFGTVIYESNFALTQKGLTFFYVNEYGIVEEITIPHAAVEKLAQ